MIPGTAASARLKSRWRARLHLLPLLGIIPSFVLASYSLTQPWARARFLVVIGISRSPEAVALVILTLAGMVGASVAAASRGPRLFVAAAVHAATGLLMCGVAWAAFHMVREAGFKLLFIPITTVRPAGGLYLWLGASILIAALGVFELAVAEYGKIRSGRAGTRPAPPSPWTE